MLRSGSGTEQLMPDSSLHYEVGIKEIYENPRKLFSIHEALAPTVTCFHEACGHGGQWRHEALKDEPLSRVLLINDLACKCSNQFYGVDPSYKNPERQYFEQPHEIAAQYIALKMTQKFLTVVYDVDKADKLLCEYVNLRIASGNEFITVPDDYEMEIPADGREPFMKPTEPFHSMKQVYERFQETFVEKVFEPVSYQNTKESGDFVNRYIKEQKWPWERIQTRNQINAIDNRLTQTYVLSGIWINQHDYGPQIRQLPVFKNIEFPNNIKELIRDIPDPPDEDELDLNALTEDDIDFARAVEQIDVDVGQSL